MNGTGVIQELTALMGELRQKQATIREQLTEIDRQVDGIQTTLDVYRTARGVPVRVVAVDNLDLHQVIGKSKSERRRNAARLLAQRNGGIIRVADTRGPMVAAGLFTGTVQWRNQMYQMFKTMAAAGDFELVKEGEYRLRDTATTSEHNLPRLLQDDFLINEGRDEGSETGLEARSG